MTKVIHLPSRHAGTCVQSSAQSSGAVSPNVDQAARSGIVTIERQAAIENALNMALYFLRQSGDTPANLWAATARTNRALTMLKQAGAGTTNHFGRA